MFIKRWPGAEEFSKHVDRWSILWTVSLFSGHSCHGITGQWTKWWRWLRWGLCVCLITQTSTHPGWGGHTFCWVPALTTVEIHTEPEVWLCSQDDQRPAGRLTTLNHFSPVKNNASCQGWRKYRMGSREGSYKYQLSARDQCRTEGYKWREFSCCILLRMCLYTYLCFFSSISFSCDANQLRGYQQG